jgi:hypothetical protein
MTDPHLDDLKNRIQQLEMSNRRWKRQAMGAWIGLGLVVLSMMVMITVTAQRSASERDAAHQMQRDAEEKARELMEAAKDQAHRALEAFQEAEKAAKGDPDKR